MRKMAGLLLLLLLLVGCARGGASMAPADGGVVEPVAALDAGIGVTLGALDAWLSWQAALAMGGRSLDGGTGPEATKRRARLEAKALSEAGLTFDEVDRIEALVAAAVSEWNEVSLGGDGVGPRVSHALDELQAEQRERAEAALFEARPAAATRPSLEARFGAETMGNVLARKAELTRAWEALVDPQGRGP